jgi:hypothetical protein
MCDSVVGQDGPCQSMGDTRSIGQVAESCLVLPEADPLQFMEGVWGKLWELASKRGRTDTEQWRDKRAELKSRLKNLLASIAIPSAEVFFFPFDMFLLEVLMIMH